MQRVSSAASRSQYEWARLLRPALVVLLLVAGMALVIGSGPRRVNADSNPFPSNGSEGAFNPPANATTVLSPGIHNFTTINIPAGAVVQTNGSGMLDLRATGAVTIDGVINVSGGNGASVGNGGIYGCGGGNSGNPTAGSCTPGSNANAPGPGGTGGQGSVGGNGSGGLGGANGGGGGFYNGYSGGGGGGGFGGGGGGAAYYYIGGAGGGPDGGPAVGGDTSFHGGRGGNGGGAPYDGGTPPNGAYCGGAGGGGSIGRPAAADLAMATTFQTGSGGGGGECDGAGGGGGGGAVRIASPASISITGQVLAKGGNGGTTNGYGGYGGGGGSGGAIYLAAPSLNVDNKAVVSAGGGVGGGGVGDGAAAYGGSGGEGRIRLMVNALSANGTFNPPLPANGNGAGLTYWAQDYPKASVTISTSLSATSVGLGGGLASDSAALSGNTSDAGGTVTYKVYSDQTCKSLVADVTPPNNTNTVVNGSVPNSTAFTPSAAGTYYWQAVYSGDGNNSGGVSDCGSEVLTVTKATPSVTTAIHDTNGNTVTSVTAGSSVTDAATVSGVSGVAAPGGTVTFTFYSTINCSDAGASAGKAVQLVNGTATSNAEAPAIVGSYGFIAQYDGDGNYTTASETCEALTVTPAVTQLTTSLKDHAGNAATSVPAGTPVHDTAMLSGATSTAGGSITYKVYSNSGCSTLVQDVTPSPSTVSNGSVPPSAEFTPGMPNTYYWQAVYSGDTNNNGATSDCSSEVLAVTQATPQVITTIQDNNGKAITNVTVGATVTDVATVSGVSGVAAPTNSVDFTFFTNSTCTGQGSDAGKGVGVNNGAATSNAEGPLAVGSYAFKAHYDGDTNYVAADGTCEPLTVAKTSPTLSTQLSASRVPAGTAVHDTAALSATATTDAGGTVTYTVHTSSDCSDAALFTSQVNVANRSVPNSADFAPSAPGSFSWQAVYTGDGNNNGTTSDCSSEVLTVTKATPQVTTVINDSSGKTVTSVPAGTTVTDAATVSGVSGVGTPTQTVSFTFYTSADCTGQASDAGTGVALSNGVATSSSEGPLAAGAYSFKAHYNGDTNYAAADGACEPLTVTQISPTVATTILDANGKAVTTVPAASTVTDSATVSGSAGTAGGTVSFTFFGSSDCSDQGTAAGAGIALSSGGATSSAEGPLAAGSHGFKAHYSGGGNYIAADGPCEPLAVTRVTPQVATTVYDAATSAPWSGTEVAGATAYDTATVTGAPGLTPAGTLTYDFFTNGGCTGTPATTGTVTLSSGVVPSSAASAPLAAGSYAFRATYSGDTNYTAADGPCEPVTVTKRTPSITTQLSASSAKAGVAVHDSATLNGATSDAGGSVTYKVYSDQGCSTLVQDVTPNDHGVSTGNVPSSANFTPDVVGTYSWKVAYSGDGNNQGVTSDCSSEQLTVTQATPSISTTLSTGTVKVGGQAHDSAGLSGTNGSAGGTVTYTVYSDDQCSKSVQKGGIKNVANGAVPDSDVLTFKQAGTFYWQAVYSGDPNNAGATSACTSEVLIVGKATPTISTKLSATGIPLGGSAHDSATLTGATPDAGGTVTYTVFSDNKCAVLAQKGGTQAVTGGVVTDSGDVTFTKAGTYYWQARYSGDPNNQGAASVCTSEVLTVAKVTPAVSTRLSASSVPAGSSVNDTATLTGATADAGGRLTYTVYTDSQCTQGAQTVGTVTVSKRVVPSSAMLKFSKAGTYYWQASYSGDGNNQPATSDCASEVLTVTRLTPQLTTKLSATTVMAGSSVGDTATVSNATPDAGGKLTYTVYTDAQCTQGARGGGTVTVKNKLVPPSATLKFGDAGTYYWQAVYQGDVNNASASSDCQSEKLVVTRATPRLTTKLSATSVIVGTKAHDSATLSSAANILGGTVTYTVYTDNKCTKGAQDAGTVTVANGLVPDSNALSFTTRGTYYWQARYSGDGNNQAVTSACTSEVLTVR